MSLYLFIGKKIYWDISSGMESGNFEVIFKCLKLFPHFLDDQKG
jgi:hypothetical protein